MSFSKTSLLSPLAWATLIVLTMGLFGFRKKTPIPQVESQSPTEGRPYRDSATNQMYNLLFCDNLALYKRSTKPPYSYPYSVLFSETATVSDLQKIVDDKSTDPRLKVLAYNKQRAKGHKPAKKELLPVIVEVGLDNGLDVLASFVDGTARYINHTGSMIVWETTTDSKSNAITNDLFAKSNEIIKKIGPWDKPRRPHPAKGNTRITFLVSDGLYFGEASTDVLFSDQMASPALSTAAQLMQYLTQKALEKKSK